jgi:hypothetical protein
MRLDTRSDTVSGQSRDRLDAGETPVSVADAARILGITEDGVRKALRRGAIVGSKDDKGAWRVWLPLQDNHRDESRDRPETGGTSPQDTSRDSPDTGLLALVDQLRSENAYLRQELSATHVLLAQLAARMPALDAGEPARSQDTGSADSARPGPVREATGAPETHRPSILVSAWRRLFGS